MLRIFRKWLETILSYLIRFVFYCISFIFMAMETLEDTVKDLLSFEK